MTALAMPSLSAAAVGTMTAPRVAVYGRVSKRKGGDGKGAHVKIESQHEQTWGRLAPEFPGATPELFADNMSAWNPDVTREDWDRMLAGIWAGRFVAVAAWASDRFTRQPGQLEDLWAACKATGTQLWTLHGGHIASALMLRIEGAIAAEESDIKSGRLKLKHASKAQAGQFHGGRRRYGYTPDMSDTVASEAAVIRDVAARVLAGSSLASIARDLRDREVPTAQGGTWTGGNLGIMLRRPHLAGIRIHNGEPHTAAWAPILDRATWERLQLLLGNPARRTSTSNARVYLLAGLATCATCGADLRGRPGTKANPTRRAYACATGRHCYRAVEDVDGVVEARVVRRLTRMSATGAVVLDGADDDMADLATERDQLLARLGEYAAAASGMSPAAYARAVSGIEADIATVERRMVEAEASHARPLAILDGMTGPGAGEAWKAADLGRRRAVLDLLCQVQLRGAATRRAPFDVEDVVVVWKIPGGNVPG